MASPFAALPFLFKFVLLRNTSGIMSWNRNWSRNSSWSSSSWQDDNNSTPAWNNWGRQQTSNQPSVPENPVPIPQTFKPNQECYDTNAVSGTFKKISPADPSPENEELVRAKRKLAAAGLELSPPVKRRTSELSEPSGSAKKPEAPLPVEQSPAEVILNKPVGQKPASYPTANTKAAMDTWLKSHQGQFCGQSVAFKKHVAEVTDILSSSGLGKGEIIDSAVRYGLNSKLAARLSISNFGDLHSSVPVRGCLTISHQPTSCHRNRIISAVQA